MTATHIIAWMTAVQSLLTVAPDVIAFGGKVKGWIDDLFGQGLITAEQQNQLHARVTEICRSALLGQDPSHWLVEEDPI